MRRELQRYLSTNQIVEIIYLDRRDKFTKRRVRLISIAGDQVKVYCFYKHAPRTFKLSNILAVQPVLDRAV